MKKRIYRKIHGYLSRKLYSDGEALRVIAFEMFLSRYNDGPIEGDDDVYEWITDIRPGLVQSRDEVWMEWDTGQITDKAEMANTLARIDITIDTGDALALNWIVANIKLL